MPHIPSSQCHKGPIVESFFDNLLPDTQMIRKRIQARFHTPTSSPYDLLKEIGRDCIGAIQITEIGDNTGTTLQTVTGNPVDETQIADIRKKIPSKRFPEAFANEFRISLAGVQKKTAFRRYHNNRLVPTGTTPTTHLSNCQLESSAY